MICHYDKTMKTIRYRFICFILFQVVFFSGNLDACTIFCLEDGADIVVGRNYDFDIGFGVVTVNERNMSKFALVDPNKKAATWTSKYGSITFNQFAHQFPCGGMNEEGLVVEMALLYQGGQYPEPDERAILNELQWIQYQLDTHAFVEEVLASDKQIRIGDSKTYLNYLVCDRKGDIAIIEFLDGRLVAYTNETLCIALAQNGLYKEAIDALSQYQGFGGRQPIPKGLSNDNTANFALTANSMKTHGQNDPLPLVCRAFAVLGDVTIPGHTQWSIVYDINDLQIHFRTMENPDMRTLRIEMFDFDCNTPSRIMDINTQIAGHTNDVFQDYSYESNKSLIDRFLDAITRIGNYPIVVSPQEREQIARYPESFECLNE